MTDTVLTVKNLSKKFKSYTGNFLAVDDISFEINKGEIVGLLGPNGAGKTTTIYMLLGVLTPSSGSIEYFGMDFSRNRKKIMSQINFSSTYSDLPWRLSVYHNLDILGRLYGISDIQNRIDSLLEKFEIKELKNKKTGDLSSGQKTIVTLVKAFLNYPKILLLDEPTASLDPDVATRVRSYILSEQKKNNISVLFTSHNMAEVEEVCDRVIFIDHGKIIAEDSPSGLARKVKLSKMQLMIDSGIEKIKSLCEDFKIKYEIKGSYVNIEISETMISDFLTMLVRNSISYTEISIKKPTLEDYFLEVLKK